MKRASLYIAAGLFAAAVVIKLVFPVQTSDTIQTTRTTVTRESSETALLTQDAPADRAVTVTINAAEFLGLDTDASGAANDLPESVETALEVFLESQAPYEEMALPVNVTYDVSMPGFPFTRPVRADASSGFGYRVHPLENLTKFHYGTDLAALSGDDILCFADGTVTEVGYDDSNGHFIRVEHQDGYASMYAHCGMIYANPGQKVSMGEKLALVGVSGKVTGPHLHFELTKNGVFLNPELVLAAL